MGTLSIGHWLIVLLVVVLVFGTKKLRNMGQDMGEALRGFKKGLSEPEQEPAKLSADPAETVAAEKHKDQANS